MSCLLIRPGFTASSDAGGAPGRLFVGIKQAKGGWRPLKLLHLYIIRAAGGRRKSGGGLPLVGVGIDDDRLAGFVVNGDGHFLRAVGGREGKPILVAGVEIDLQDERLLGLELAAPAAVAQL